MNAKEVLNLSLQLLERGDARAWCNLFAEGGVLEFPYAPPGWPTRFEGRDEIWGQMEKFAEHLSIKFSDVTFYETSDPNLTIGEFHGDGTALATGNPLSQDYLTVLWTENGQITRYRDFWNPIRHLEALGGAEAAAAIVQS